MKLILLKKIDKLGNSGDIINVKYGYAYNFLLPKKIAILYENNENNKNKFIKKTKKKILKIENKIIKLKNLNIKIYKNSFKKYLYENITKYDLLKIFKKNKINLKINEISIFKIIKNLGFYKIKIIFNYNIFVNIFIKILNYK